MARNEFFMTTVVYRLETSVLLICSNFVIILVLRVGDCSIYYQLNSSKEK